MTSITHKKKSCRQLWLFLIILPCLDKTFPRFISERLFNTKTEEKNKETDKFSESLGAFQKLRYQGRRELGTPM